jgi:dephospho-CoA kinase
MGLKLRVGLTGGIASGKTVVTVRFRELGVPVIDADEAARAVVEPGSKGLADVVARFGGDILAADGSLNRGALRRLIFSDQKLRQDLEGILHPRIRLEMERRAENAVGPYLVMAIPLLVEAGNVHQVNRILVVDADEATQMARLMARDGSSETEARAVLAAQASRESRLKAADDVLVNRGSVAELRQAVDKIHQQYLRLAATGRGPKI